MDKVGPEELEGDREKDCDSGDEWPEGENRRDAQLDELGAAGDQALRERTPPRERAHQARGTLSSALKLSGRRVGGQTDARGRKRRGWPKAQPEGLYMWIRAGAGASEYSQKRANRQTGVVSPRGLRY